MQTNFYSLPISLAFRYVLVVVSLLFCRCSEKSSGTTDLPLVISPVNVIDAQSGLRENQTVIIRGQRMVQVGAAETLEIPANSTVINGNGQYLIPGLWDAHVHLTYQPDIAHRMFPLFIANGITSVRDTGGPLNEVLSWREKARKDSLNAPRVKVAGPLLDGSPYVYDGSSPFRPAIGTGSKSVEEARNKVVRFHEAGVDFIKAYEMLSPGQFMAVLDEAENRGLMVTGHVPLSMDVPSVSKAGLRSMEHMRNLEMSCTANPGGLLERRRNMLDSGKNKLGGVLRSNIHQAQRHYAVQHQDEEQVQQVLSVLAENETWQIPTLTIVAARMNRLYAQPEWRKTFQTLTDSVARKWTSDAITFSEAPADSASLAFAKWGFDMVGKMNNQDVDIMAGTDCPIFFLTPGFSLHKELEYLVASGLTPLQALASATLKPAAYFSMDDELGTIAPGMLADLVLLRKNPLENIAHTTTIEAVVRNGKFHTRSSLDSMLRPRNTLLTILN